MTPVLVCRGPGQEVLDTCWGVAASGSCPQASPGEPVRCAGLQIVIQREQHTPFVFDVEPEATMCPAAALGVLPRLTRATVACRSRKEASHGQD